MKIERINDRKIRCELDRADLEARNITPAELTSRSEKVRALFRELLAIASRDLNFEFHNIPLMVEVVSLVSGNLCLIVTKVVDQKNPKLGFNGNERTGKLPGFVSESPHMIEISPSEYTNTNNLNDIDDLSEQEDWDPSSEDQNSQPGRNSNQSDAHGLDDGSADKQGLYEGKRLFDLWQLDSLYNLYNDSNFAKRSMIRADKTNSRILSSPFCITFLFSSFDLLTEYAKQIKPICRFRNTLFKDEKIDSYILVIYFEKKRGQYYKFASCWNTGLEYATFIEDHNIDPYYYKEHCTTMIAKDAIYKLSSLS